MPGQKDNPLNASQPHTSSTSSLRTAVLTEQNESNLDADAPPPATPSAAPSVPATPAAPSSNLRNSRSNSVNAGVASTPAPPPRGTSPGSRAKPTPKLKKYKSRPHLKRITSGVTGSHPKLIFSVDDDIHDEIDDVVEENQDGNNSKIDRDYLEGYSDALKAFYQKKARNIQSNADGEAGGTNVSLSTSEAPPSNSEQGYFAGAPHHDPSHEAPPQKHQQKRHNQPKQPSPALHKTKSLSKSDLENAILSNLLTTEENIRNLDADGPAPKPSLDASGNADDEDISDTHHNTSNDGGGADDDDDNVDDDDDDQNSLNSVSSNDTIESLNLRERQDAINSTHPFGIKIWKPSLYKKNRSVATRAQEDIHDFDPRKTANIFWGVTLTNAIWTCTVGFFLFVLCCIGAMVVFIFSGFAYHHHSRPYVKLLFKLGRYWLNPFGKFVLLHKDKNYLDEDELDGRSISEFERWRLQEEGRLFFAPPRRFTSGAEDESRPLLKDHKGRPLRDAYSTLGESARQNTNMRFEQSPGNADLENSAFEDDDDENNYDDEDLGNNANDIKVRFFGRGSWSSGRLVFYLFFYAILQPLLFLLGVICWVVVFTIPMANITNIVCDHLRRHPLALHFELEKNYYEKINDERLSKKYKSQSIIVCTYRCCGFHYYKYTIDGTNIFLINLLSAVVFVIFDYFVLKEKLGWESWYTESTFLFCACLFSIIPLAYFIGQAVASISAQSSMGVGAVINAFFSTVVEIFLYCVALNQGKGKLVEGSMIGSILGGVLLLPGLSMCGGALKRKTQRYNPRSAGVSSTMLLFAMVIMFAPSFFYQLYGPYEIKCKKCTFHLSVPGGDNGDDCVKCRFIQPSFALDELYYSMVRPFSLIVVSALFLAYVCGLFFTLRTHASLIWATNSHEQAAIERKQENYMRSPSVISLDHAQVPRLDKKASKLSTLPPSASYSTSVEGPANHPQHKPITSAKNSPSVEVAKLRFPKRDQLKNPGTGVPNPAEITTGPHSNRKTSIAASKEEEQEEEAGAGHDAPNWSRNKSTVILLGATLLYAVIAEILVDNVDSVLSDFPIDPKFLGLTVFALVPNTTEFLNAISFAVGGNVALSMEIGSAYALQVVLIQIPSLVVYSIVKNFDDTEKIFSLVFPRWDIIATLIAIYLFTYVYAEGKSNYFKGVILILSYCVVLIGFWLNDQIEELDDGYAGGPKASQMMSSLVFGY